MDDHANLGPHGEPHAGPNDKELSRRDFAESDAPVICTFARTPRELFLFIPPATFPLTPDQLLASAMVRECSTVILDQGEVAGYANLYDVHPGEYCFTGNVIVDPLRRGKGLGSYLLACMEERARTLYRVKEHRISCVAFNTSALLWYSRLGYRPYGVEERTDYEGNAAALIHMARPAAA